MSEQHETRVADAEAIIEVAREAAGREALPHSVDPEKLYVTLGIDGRGSLRPEVLDLEVKLPRPRRKIAAVTLYTPASFSAYVDRHRGDGTTVWADVERSQMVAVIDDHEQVGAGWGEHRALLALRHPPAWTKWMSRDGKLGSQAEFAEHIEDCLPEIVEPDGATMLELAQTFHATGQVNFRQHQRLATGAVQMTYEQTHEARAGERGQIEIPPRFVVALAPFEGIDSFRVEARLRYRINDGTLRIGYVLDRPEEVLRAAFAEILDTVGKALEDVDVLSGTPRA